ncbi:MAG: hypothetical protein H6740_10895 [Alphaproteobacteria bacterium]|nr:hypothetical protein [Alphaproteobacteria bacterium]
MTPLRTLRLPPSLVDRGFRLERVLARHPDLNWSEGYRLLEGFTLSSRERCFAQRLLRERRNWWLWRCHQKAFAGDFLLVDLSEPRPQARRVIAVELKARAPLSPCGGVQLARVQEAVAELTETGVITKSPEILGISGDKDAVLGWLGAGRPAL